jgi:hypothetical protein
MAEQMAGRTKIANATQTNPRQQQVIAVTAAILVRRTFFFDCCITAAPGPFLVWHKMSATDSRF